MNKTISSKPTAKEVKAERRKNSYAFQTWLRLKKSRTAMIGLFIISIFVIVLLFADVITPYEAAIQTNPKRRLEAASSDFWFGTDNLGRDVFARLIHGTRNSLAIGVFTTLGALFVGGILGSIAGYYGGRTDNIIMRLTDILAGIPPMLMSLAIIAALGANLRNLVISLIISTIPNFIRLVRSSVLLVTQDDFIEASISYGSKDFHIILKHVIPNAMAPIIVQTTMTIASMILQSSGLSFLGLGVRPPAPEWGAMLSDGAQFMRTSPQLLIYPGLAIVLAALSFNLLGDGLRDALDPKLKN